MILAGLILLGVGSADLLRRISVAARRHIGLAVGALALIALGAGADALLPALLAVAVAAEWVWLMPAGRAARAGVWPAIGVLALCGLGVAVLGVREEPGLIGQWWHLPSPTGAIPFDLVVLVVGALVFLAESANIVVRAALGNETNVPSLPQQTQAETEAAPDADAAVPFESPPSLKGGRMIGPLERMVVFALTLAGAYTLLAAVLAAKGIVRFPEISRDDDGDRAEYFLVGSLVSWVLALAVSLLVWWGHAGLPA